MQGLMSILFLKVRVNNCFCLFSNSFLRDPACRILKPDVVSGVTVRLNAVERLVVIFISRLKHDS